MINFKRIVTQEEILSIGQDKYEFAVKEGIYHGEYVRRRYDHELLYGTRYLDSRSMELAHSSKYKNESYITKTVIATNILFPDNTKTIQFLVSKNITYDRLCKCSKLISKLKQIALLADGLIDDKQVTIAHKNVNGLCLLFKKYYGTENFELVIAKINELVTHHKDLYLSLEKEMQK